MNHNYLKPFTFESFKDHTSPIARSSSPSVEVPGLITGKRFLDDLLSGSIDCFLGLGSRFFLAFLGGGMAFESVSFSSVEGGSKAFCDSLSGARGFGGFDDNGPVELRL